jgi:hypothetical protein
MGAFGPCIPVKRFIDSDAGQDYRRSKPAAFREVLVSLVSSLDVLSMRQAA